MRSDNVKTGMQQAPHRSLFNALGLIRFIQKFLDLSDNIENEELKEEVIRAMLMCDERLTQLAELEFENLNKN